MFGHDSEGDLGSRVVRLGVERGDQGVEGAGGDRPRYDPRHVKEDGGDGDSDESPARVNLWSCCLGRPDHPRGPQRSGISHQDVVATGDWVESEGVGHSSTGGVVFEGSGGVGSGVGSVGGWFSRIVLE